ncbi:HBR435Cp [Eremothecium sinecaudum]|uniref:HBR435Cp n=1 Tax=Eremothecium sinecaudum TaxID=45286 RepID=A0A120K1H0_9SACH|nr:HBR435Cp [Eremothecium sinecaudum]AMD19336.1 HBR435Cp [Eremothecium sinecaudum]
MRRRNKIKPRLPNLSISDSEQTTEGSSSHRTQNTRNVNVKLVHTNDFDDDIDDNTYDADGTPFGGQHNGLEKIEQKLRNRKKQMLNVISHDEDESNADDKHQFYSKLFKSSNKSSNKKDKVSIVNLEDLSQEEEGEEDSQDDEGRMYPSEKQIQAIKQKKAIDRQKYNTESTGFYNSTGKSIEYNERAYAKLLDQDDKEILNDVLNRGNKGPPSERDFSDGSNDYIDNEKLPLSKLERESEAHRRKIEIESALNDDSVVGDDWESNQLKKLANKDISVARKRLPELAVLDERDDLCLTELAIRLLRISQEDPKVAVVEKQLGLIREEIGALTMRQSELITLLDRQV